MSAQRGREIKIVHVITGMVRNGGAQTMLYKLLSGLDRTVWRAQVVSLVGIGPVGEKIRALGVPVRTLGMRRGVPNPFAVYRLSRWFRQDPPQIVQTWLYHADFLGGLAAKIAGDIPVAWNIRHSSLDGDKLLSRWTVRVCARLSHRLPTRIVCCSEVARQIHIQLGYAADRMVVIPNGFDLAAFKPNPAARQSVRQELGLARETVLIGLVGRFHRQKDHRSFVEAAARLHTNFPEVHFLLCGDEVTWENPELVGWITAAGLRRRCHLLGRREDMPRLTAALDIATVASSYGEGFPNVVGEAMACGIPCVVTDVGDSPLIVQETGSVVPPKRPQALAAAWGRLIEVGPEERRRLGLAARRRVETHFSLPTVTGQYQRLHEELVAYPFPFRDEGQADYRRAQIGSGA